MRKAVKKYIAGHPDSNLSIVYQGISSHTIQKAVGTDTAAIRLDNPPFAEIMFQCRLSEPKEDSKDVMLLIRIYENEIKYVTSKEESQDISIAYDFYVSGEGQEKWKTMEISKFENVNDVISLIMKIYRNNVEAEYEPLNLGKTTKWEKIFLILFGAAATIAVIYFGICVYNDPVFTIAALILLCAVSLFRRQRRVHKYKNGK